MGLRHGERDRRPGQQAHLLGQRLEGIVVGIQLGEVLQLVGWGCLNVGVAGAGVVGTGFGGPPQPQPSSGGRSQ